jgi:hypothetical protein
VRVSVDQARVATGRVRWEADPARDDLKPDARDLARHLPGKNPKTR